MTTTRNIRRATPALIPALLALLLTACASKPDELIAPRSLATPYSRAGGDLLFAVVPLRNESGTTLVDTLAITDELSFALNEATGVSALPVNRVIAAMRAIGIEAITTPDEGRQLAESLGVDGLVLGSVTAYDPYEPPIIGLSLAIQARTPAIDARGPSRLDPQEIAASPTEWTYFPGSGFGSPPASVISEHLDARNHAVLMSLREYAQGRHEPDAALGWRSHLASMDLYARFAAHYAIGKLMEEEAARLARSRRTASR